MLAALLTPRRLILLAAALAVALVVLLLWYFLIRSDAPPPASLEAAVESVLADQQAEAQDAPQQSAQRQGPPQSVQQSDGALEQTVSVSNAEERGNQGPSEAADPGSQQSAPPAQEDAEDEPPSDPPALPALADLAGSWVLSERGESFVGYRIGEELASIGTATAVGRTSEITAALEFDGEAVTSVEIVADLRTLKSDQGFRDSALRDRGLESDTYPFAVFKLTEAISIDIIPVAGDTLSTVVNGTLDLHGVVNDVSIELAGQYVDGLVVVSGSTEIVLLDYEIEAPVGFRVLSIEESGLMEFQIVFEPAP